MENNTKRFYCHKRLNENGEIKGEYDKQTSSFVHYLWKSNEGKIMKFKLPVSLGGYKVDFLLQIDFKSSSIIIQANIIDYSNIGKENSLVFTRKTIHNELSLLFNDDCRKNIQNFFNNIDKKRFLFIKQNLRRMIQTSLNNKLYALDSYFVTIKFELNDFFTKIPKFDQELKEKYQMIIHSQISTNFHKEFINNLKNELFETIEEMKECILSSYNIVKKSIKLKFYKNENSEIEKETLYNNLEKSQNENFPRHSILFSNHKTNNTSILNLQIEEEILLYKINEKNMEYLTLKCFFNNTKIVLHKNPEGFLFKFGNIIFSLSNSSTIKNYFYLGQLNEFEEKEGVGCEGYLNKEEESDELNFYIGSFKKNVYDGIGILDNKNYFYKGDFTSARKNGKCEIFFKKDNELYIGDIKENYLQGKGKYVYNTQNREISYDGEISNNLPNGKGRIIYKNFDIFLGEFTDGKKTKAGNYINKINDSVKIYYDKEGFEIKEKTKYIY